MTQSNQPARPGASAVARRKPRYSYRSRVLGAALGTFVRPIASIWPMRAGALALMNHCAGVAALLVRDAAVEPVTLAGVPAERGRTATVSAPTRIVLHVHGGGFVFGTPRMYREYAARLSAATNSEVFVLDYQHPPRASVTTMTAEASS